MNSYLRCGLSGLRVTAGVISLGIALFYSGMAQAAPQYDVTCSTCHQMPPLDSASGLREPATGAVKGNHKQHAGTTAASCEKCHGNGVANYPTGHRDKTIQVQGNINTSPATGTYNRPGFLNQTSVPPASLGSCSNVNCHFEVVSDNWGVLPASTYTQIGANGTTCGKCHGAPPSDGNHPAAGGPGKKHGDYYGTGTGSCKKCHPDHAAAGLGAFNHATSAGKRSLLLQFTDAPNSGGTYSGNIGYPAYLNSQNPPRNGTCTTTYCHSDGRGNDPKTIPTWGSTLSPNCTGCHGGNAATGVDEINTNKHQKHIDNAGFLGSNYACAECHAPTVDTDTHIVSYANHVKGFVSFSGAHSGKNYSSATKVCSNVYCHSAGKAAAPQQPAAPNWTSGGPLDCKSCHGIGGSYGEPSYASADGVAGNLANSHTAKHVNNAASCANCHANTTVDGASIKPGSTSHTNGSANVDFAATYDLGGAGYNSAVGTKSCSSIYCHSDGNGGIPLQTPQWGGSVTCTSCHGNDATSGAPIASNKHSVHMNNYSALGRGNNLQCADCHAKTVDSNTHIANSANHINKLKDYSGARAGKNYDAGQKVCSNVYCHSNGLLTDLVYRNMTGSKAWNGNAKMGCKGCHGYGPGEFNSLLGEPNYVNGGIGSGMENSHEAHTIRLGVTTTKGCAKCHRVTVDAGAANKLRDYSSMHLNREVDLSFQPLGNFTGHFDRTTKTCYNTYCHAGAPSQWGGPQKHCADCHKADATLGGNHFIHWQSTGIYPTAYVSTPGNTGDATQYRWSCSSCHQGEDANGPPAYGGGSAAEIFFGYTSGNRKGTYTYGSDKTLDGTLVQSDGTCSNLYCHSDGNGGDPKKSAFNWYSPDGGTTLGCAGCHGGNAASTSPIDTGKHTVHMNNPSVLGVNFGCVDCHARTVNSDSNVSDKRKHVNKFKDYSGLYANGTFYTGPNQNCANNAYCHTNGGKVSETATPVTWSDSGSWASKCDKCHGLTSGGSPDYVNGGAGTISANSHAKHPVAYGFVCSECHNRTTKDGSTIRTDVNPPAHINKVTDDIFFNLSGNNKNGTYAKGVGAGKKTCANIYCHSDGTSAVTFTPISTAQWGASLSCKGCHGYTQASGHMNTTNAHDEHLGAPTVTGKAIGCQDCHNVTTTDGTTIANHATHNSHNVNIKFDNSVNLNGDTPTYDSQGTTGANGYAKAVGNASTNNTCANVYCHSTGTVNGASPTFKPVAWSTSWGGSKCVNCHGDGSGRSHNSPDVNNNPGGGNANNHVKHVEMKGFSCDYCHINTTTAAAVYPALPTAVVDGGSHLNRTDNVNFKSYGAGGLTGSYNSTVGTKSCSSTYCHSSGEATPAAPLKTAKWGDKLDCRGCHGGDAAHANPIGTNKHAKHMNNPGYLGLGNNFQCAECHAKTISTFANNTTIGVQTNHVNTYRDYSGVKAYKTGYAAGSCTTYCHSSGQATPVFRSMTGSKIWSGGATFDCNGCHGYGSGEFTARAGEPNYFTAAGKENSHKKHVYDAGITDSKGCAKCHRTTVDASAAGKLRDYSSGHLNKVRDVSFAKLGNYTGHYTAGSKTCSNIYCHAGSPVTWGANGTLNCTSCHKGDSNLPGAHAAHWDSSAGTATTYTGTPGNTAGGDFYQFQCASCHAGVHAAGPSAQSGANGNSAEIFFAYTSSNRKGTYTFGGTSTGDGTLKWSNGTCSATYCHSNGRGGNPKKDITQFSWNSATNGSVLGSGVGCAGCHGGNAASFAPISTNRHAYHINPALTGNTAVLPAGFACGECHAKTVSTASDTVVIDKKNHVNKFRDYSGAKGYKTFYTGTGANCNTTYCHSNGKGTQNGNNVTWAQTTTWTNKCNQCHGTGTTNGAPDYASGSAGSATANSHGKHTAGTAGSYSFTCDLCHFKTAADNTTIVSGGGHLNQGIEVNLKKPYSGYSNYSGYYNGAVGLKGCANTYCHGGNQTSAQWGAPTPLVCDSCHNASNNGAKPLPAGHSIHYADTAVFTSYTATPGNRSTGTTYKFACSSCHTRALANHVNGPISGTQAAQVFFGFSTAGKKPAYAGGAASAQDGQSFYYTTNGTTAGASAGGSCNTTYCHSNGNGGPGNATTANSHAYNWGTSAGTITCAGCHGGNAASFAPISSGKHKAHINNISANYSNGNFGCVQCHAKTVSSDTTLVNAAKHVNKFKDYSGAYAYKSGYAGGNTTCATYCHSNGKLGTSVGIFKGYTTWYNITRPALGCNGCHGTERGGVVSGFPNYTSGNAGLANANSHRRHVTDKAINCSTCHYGTTTNGSSIAAGGRHINGNIQADVVFNGVGGSAIYNGGGKSCSNISCHSNGAGGYQQPQWGGVMSCISCHPMNQLSRGHAFHVYTSATNAPVSYNNYTANRSNGAAAPGRYNYGCGNCHPVNNPNHGNGLVLIDLQPSAAGGALKNKNGAAISVGGVVAGTANSGTSGTAGSSITCSNVYCHSNGYASSVVFATTPDWYTGSFAGDRCAACHGNWPNDTIAGSPTHYNSNWLGAGSAGGHAMGIHAKKIVDGAEFTTLLTPGSTGNVSHGIAAQATTISCNTCHNATVTTAANNGSAQCSGCHTLPATQAFATIADKSKHVNGSVQVVFQTTTVNSKAQLRDAAFALNSSSTLWHRNNGYKSTVSPYSFDSSKQNLNVSNPYVSGGNCTTICHFNKPVSWNNTPAATCYSCHNSM